MRKNWVNDVLDDAVRAVRSWPSWMLRTEVRSPEGAPQSNSAPEGDIEIIVSEALPPDTIMLVPVHPLTAEETERARVLMAAGWSEMEAIAEVRARQCAAIKCAAS